MTDIFYLLYETYRHRGMEIEKWNLAVFSLRFGHLKREKLGPSTCQAVMSKRESGSIYFSNQTNRNEKIIRQSSVIPIFVQNCKHLRKNGCMRTIKLETGFAFPAFRVLWRASNVGHTYVFRATELVLRWTMLPMRGILYITWNIIYHLWVELYIYELIDTA